MEYFIWPFVIMTLPLPWLVRRWIPAARVRTPGKERDALRIPFWNRLVAPKEINAVMGNKGVGFWLTLAWISLVIAAMRPVWYEHRIPLPQEARNIMLALDFSGSMARKDFVVGGVAHSRTDVVKQVVRDFISRRQGDRLGLVVFGDAAYTLSPLSRDHRTLDALFADMGPDITRLIGNKTAIGDALTLGVQNVANLPAGQKSVILLSDGANNAGRVPVWEAIRLAQRQQVPVYTIGITTARKEKSTLISQMILTELTDWNEQTLMTIAEKTGGKYFRASDTRDLVQIYREIDRLETAQTNALFLRPRRELFYIPLLIGLFCWAWAEKRRRQA